VIFLQHHSQAKLAISVHAHHYVHAGRLTSVRSKHLQNLKLDAGFRKQVGQVCENKLLVRRPTTTTKNSFLTNGN
jgi:hypothetical protein